jgi:hypothetical protein
MLYGLFKKKSRFPVAAKHSCQRIPVTLHGVVFDIFILGRSACDKLTRRAKFSFRRRANRLYDSRHPVPKEGALAIVTERWDGMWWTRRHRARDGMAGRDKLRERSWDVLTSGAEAYGEDVWS